MFESNRLTVRSKDTEPSPVVYYATLGKEEIWDIAQKVYKDYPELLRAAYCILSI